jgi:hypothetical protein
MAQHKEPRFLPIPQALNSLQPAAVHTQAIVVQPVVATIANVMAEQELSANQTFEVLKQDLATKLRNQITDVQRNLETAQRDAARYENEYRESTQRVFWVTDEQSGYYEPEVKTWALEASKKKEQEAIKQQALLFNCKAQLEKIKRINWGNIDIQDIEDELLPLQQHEKTNSAWFPLLQHLEKNKAVLPTAPLPVVVVPNTVIAIEPEKPEKRQVLLTVLQEVQAHLNDPYLGLSPNIVSGIENAKVLLSLEKQFGLKANFTEVQQKQLEPLKQQLTQYQQAVQNLKVQYAEQFETRYLPGLLDSEPPAFVGQLYESLADWLNTEVRKEINTLERNIDAMPEVATDSDYQALTFKKALLEQTATLNQLKGLVSENLTDFAKNGLQG